MYLLRSRCLFWALCFLGKHRSKASPNWILRLSFSLFAAIVSHQSILCITLISKFGSGGWITVVLTCFVIAICMFIKRHYNIVNKKLIQLDTQLKQPITEIKDNPIVPDPLQPTAVVLVGKSPGISMHTLLMCTSHISATF